MAVNQIFISNIITTFDTHSLLLISVCSAGELLVNLQSPLETLAVAERSPLGFNTRENIETRNIISMRNWPF